ncbi:hypothetical protein ACWGBX_08630, partial [Streptomyces sp. NPDC055037]
MAELLNDTGDDCTSTCKSACSNSAFKVWCSGP